MKIEPQFIDQCYSCLAQDIITNEAGECPHCYAEIADMSEIYDQNPYNPTEPNRAGSSAPSAR